MTLRTIKRLITGLAGLAVLFAGVSLIGVPKAHALYCGVKTVPPGFYKTNLSCSPTGCGTWYVPESSQGIREGVCVDNRAVLQPEPASPNAAR